MQGREKEGMLERIVKESQMGILGECKACKREWLRQRVTASM